MSIHPLEAIARALPPYGRASDSGQVAQAGDDGNVTPCLIDVTVAAKMLTVSTRTIWRLVEIGQLPRPLHIGRCARWEVLDLLAFIESLREQVAHEERII
jgi:predicted DNA-binding transcriptional regulator AlpA